MNRIFKRRHLLLLLPLLVTSLFAASRIHAQTSATILNRDQAGPLFPSSVFYKGQIAPIQARNSAGLRFPDSKLALTALVDTSGYSTAVQQTYQGYLIAEVPLRFGDKTLAPGAYGFGFIAGDRMVVMDLGGNEVLNAQTKRDQNLARPNPLQMLPDPDSNSRFHLYLGRSYVTLEAASK